MRRLLPSFPPSRRKLNPVVASLLHGAASRMLDAGGTAGCGVDAAVRVRSFAGRWIRNSPSISA